MLTIISTTKDTRVVRQITAGSRDAKFVPPALSRANGTLDTDPETGRDNVITCPLAPCAVPMLNCKVLSLPAGKIRTGKSANSFIDKPVENLQLSGLLCITGGCDQEYDHVLGTTPLRFAVFNGGEQTTLDPPNKWIQASMSPPPAFWPRRWTSSNRPRTYYPRVIIPVGYRPHKRKIIRVGHIGSFYPWRTKVDYESEGDRISTYSRLHFGSDLLVLDPQGVATYCRATPSRVADFYSPDELERQMQVLETWVYYPPRGTSTTIYVEYYTLTTERPYATSPEDLSHRHAFRRVTPSTRTLSTVSVDGECDIPDTILREAKAYCSLRFGEADLVDARGRSDPGSRILACTENLRYLHINSTHYIRDLFHLKEMLKPVAELVRKPLSPKAWANAWLTYRYGLTLFLHDSSEIAKAIERVDKAGKSPRITSARAREYFGRQGLLGPITGYKALHLRCASQSMPESIVTLLRQADLWLSLVNIWDWIPYSFVVDWFIPVERYLSRLDSANDFETFNDVESLLWATKESEEVVEPSNLPLNLGTLCTGSLQVVWFVRSIDDASHTSLDTAFPQEWGSGINLIHTADGAALVAQRRLR